MAEQSQEKDYFWFIIGGIGVLAVLGILAFKNLDVRNEHVAGKGYSPDTTAAAEAQAFHNRKNLNNNSLQDAK